MNWFVTLMLCIATCALTTLLLIRVARDRSRRVREKRQAQLRRRRVRHTALRAELAQARASLDRQADFLAAVAHDLRQPLHAIGLLLSSLEQRLARVDSGEAPVQSVRDLLRWLDRSMLGVDDQVHRLLDLSRLQGGAIQPQLADVALRPLLEALEARFAPLALTRQLRFRLILRSDLTCHTDPALLVEVMMNLLSNAFRYTDRGGIAIVARQRKQGVQIQIRDTGPGMKPYQANEARLGKSSGTEHHRLTSPGPVTPGAGLGLGLSIVTQLCAALDIPVVYRSRAGKGTTFSLFLRNGVSGHVDAGSVPALDAQQTQQLKGLLVLLIDDDVNVLVAMESALTGIGMFVLVARTVEEALQVIDRSDRFPDLLLTDHQVGTVSSDIVIARVRQAVPTRLPVLVVTGDTRPSTIEQIQAGGHALLTKPVALARLVMELAQINAGDAAKR